MSFKSKFQSEGKEVYKTKDEGGLSFTNYLNIKQFNIERFKDEDDKDYLVDIVPYTIETENHPEKKKGEKTFHLDIWAHKGIGADKGNYLCMKKMYNQPCKICEHFIKLQNDGLEWDEIKNLYPTRRSIYWFLYKGKLFVADMSFKIFEELWLQAVEKLNTKGKDIFPIYLNEDGCTSLEFSTTNKRGIGRYVQFEFSDIENYNPEIEKKAISLEKLLVIPDQFKLEQVLNGMVYDENIETSTEENDSPEEKEPENNYYEEVVEKEVKEQKEEIQEPAKKKKKVVENECPFGTQFGKDWDEYEHCDKCVNEHSEIYENCKKTYKENK